MPETQLASEDLLRLNVLASQASAVRIIESEMCVLGLTENGERRVQLNPSGPPTRYLRAVRELLSSIAMQSPGGYPVFMSRWTRMGQLDGARLCSLLRLGEPEAVIAVASSRSIDADLARQAWWAHPETETARFLLEHPAVRDSSLGRELVSHLLEYLPFEQSPGTVANDVRLAVGSGLLSADELDSLWRRGQRRTSTLLGFLQARPASLADPYGGDDRFPADPAALTEALRGGRGRRFFETTAQVLQRPGDQDIVVGALEVLSTVLLPLRPPGGVCSSITEIEERSGSRGKVDNGAGDEGEADRDLLFLSLVGEPLVREFFSRSSTVGALMRRQLSPILDPVSERLTKAAATA